MPPLRLSTFKAEPLHAALARMGVEVERPTFFSWLGVSMYLTREAVDAALRAVAAFPPASEMVLTFAQPRRTKRPVARRSRGRCRPGWLRSGA